jgi:hypothetical protein
MKQDSSASKLHPVLLRASLLVSCTFGFVDEKVSLLTDAPGIVVGESSPMTTDAAVVVDEETEPVLSSTALSKISSATTAAGVATETDSTTVVHDDDGALETTANEKKRSAPSNGLDAAATKDRLSKKSPKLLADGNNDTLGDNNDQGALSLKNTDSVQVDSSKLAAAGIVHDKATLPSNVLLLAAAPRLSANDEAVVAQNEALELDLDQNRPALASEEGGNNPPPLPPRQQQQQQQPEPSIDVTKPVKRARSAYFIFADETRPQIQKQVLPEIAVYLYSHCPLCAAYLDSCFLPCALACARTHFVLYYSIREKDSPWWLERWDKCGVP